MESDRFDMCFACGADNPIGLRLVFDCDSGEARCVFRLDPVFEGYHGVIHGGIVATILDEAMAKVLLFNKVSGFTARLTVQYKKPLRSGTEYLVRGMLTGRKFRVHRCAAEIADAGGECVATAEGEFMEVRVH